MRTPKPARRTVVLAACASAAAAGLGCSGGGEDLVLVGDQRVEAADIDRDPLALLPRGALMLAYLDAASLFASGFGPDVSRLVSSLLPLGPESNFVPSRDVVRMVGGAYAMQGADYCFVAQGNFDVDAIRRAADARLQTPGGGPLVRTRYGTSDLYTAGNVGFVLLTAHTMLAGNETGMRRALDRLRFGKLQRDVPGWMVDLASTKGAAFALAGDLTGQAAVEAAAQRAPFLAGMRRVRIVGNFQPPGLNFAGAASYADVQSAAAGAGALQNLQQITQFVSLLSSWGFGTRVPPIRVVQNGTEVAFTAPFDDAFVRLLLGVAADALRRR